MSTLIGYGKRIVVVLGLVVLALLVMDFNSRMAELHRLTVQEERLGVEATAQKQTQEALETEVAYATSPAAVDGVLREEGHQALPGDTVVIIVTEAGAAAAPATAPPSTPEPISNWDMWLALIFGQSP